MSVGVGVCFGDGDGDSDSDGPATVGPDEIPLLDEAEVGIADEPHFGIADKSHVGVADKPHVGVADKPHVGVADKPHVGAGDERRSGVDADRRFGVDDERRFGGLRRLYGAQHYGLIRAAHVVVVGVGGVGSWSAEALARCGVAALTLIDLDHVAESNINRQVQALGSTLGRAKPLALAKRIADIHPACTVHQVEDFVDADNWPNLLRGARPSALIDACDDSRAKTVLAAWSLATGLPFVCVGAAGGRTRPETMRIDDLADVTHDALLAGLRQRLRRLGHIPRVGAAGVRCVHSRSDEPIQAPAPGGSGLQCAGYGSSAMVTASFGMAAAAEVLAQLAAPRWPATIAG